MPKIRLIPSGIPEQVLESEPIFRKTVDKIIKLSRVPSIGKSIIWQAHNFTITKVTHTLDSEYAAVIEMKWCESSPLESDEVN